MSFSQQSETWQDKGRGLNDDRHASEGMSMQSNVGKVFESRRQTLNDVFDAALETMSNRGDPNYKRKLHAETKLAFWSIRGREMRMEELKGMGEACAVVSVFVASVGVGLLSYTHDIFSDRPDLGEISPPTSDSAITCLFLTSVILAIVAAMEFTILQITVTRANRATRPPPPELSARDQTAGEKGKETQPTYDDRDISNDREEKDIETGSREQRGIEDAAPTGRTRATLAWSIRLWDHDMLKIMASISMSLLFFSWLTLLAGIFTFIWSNERKSVKIAITVLVGGLCPLPIFHIYTFHSTF